jgi:hypothetical protein
LATTLKRTKQGKKLHKENTRISYFDLVIIIYLKQCKSSWLLIFTFSSKETHLPEKNKTRKETEQKKKKKKGVIKKEEKVNFCSIIKRKLYSLYFDTGLFQKGQKTSYLKNNNVFNEYRQYNSCQTLQPGLNLSTAKRMTSTSS